MSGAQAPPAGMKRIPMPLESYQSLSPPLNSKRLLNLYAEKQPDDSLTAAALVPTPGLRKGGMGAFGTGPVVAVNGDIPGLFYVVSGTHLYRYNSDAFPFAPYIHDLGDIGVPDVQDYAPHFMVTIAVGVNACVVCVPPKAYTCAHNSNVLNEITGDFPGARSVTYLDGYFVFTADEIGAQFFCSGLLDPTAFDALDFAFADGEPDILRRVMTLRGELWFIGDTSIEVWYDAGSSGLETTPGISFFPFRRRAGGVLQHGTLSIKTCAIADRSLFWLSDTGIVMRSVGYNAQRVSTHAIEGIIRNTGISQITLAYAYVQDGHTFYVLNYANRSLVYDLATGAWHERSSSADGSAPWRPLCAGKDGEVNLLGDSLSGNLFEPLPWLGTEDNEPVIRQFITPPLFAETRRAFCSRLEIEMETGTYPPVGDLLLEWSDDGGYTWKGPRVIDAGHFYTLRKRVFATRLGSFRQRMFRVTTQQRATFYLLEADIQAGAH